MLYYSNVTYVRRHMSKTEGRDKENREAFAKLTVPLYIEGCYTGYQYLSHSESGRVTSEVCKRM